MRVDEQVSASVALPIHSAARVFVVMKPPYRVISVLLVASGCIAAPPPAAQRTTAEGNDATDGVADASVDGSSSSHAGGGANGSGSHSPGGADAGSSDKPADGDQGSGDPTPQKPADDAYFPFPQGRALPHCTEPSTSADDVRAAWNKWKDRAIVGDGAGGHLRVRRWESNDDTVSEGVAYGMLGAVYMNDQDTFDALLEYAKAHANDNGFMHWNLDAQGNVVQPNGYNGATDADEDMAWALLMADRQWGGSGSLGRAYLELALEMIDAIWRTEIDHSHGHVLKPGDKWGGASETNPSYFAPSYYRVFGKVSGNVAGWQRVIDSSYDILSRAADAQTGLVPEWCNSDGNNTRNGEEYHYNACRVPFRLALDYCANGEPRALELLQRMSGFFAGQGASGIWDGYRLSGAPFKNTNKEAMAFVGPAGVGAMGVSGREHFVADVYDQLLVLGARDDWAYSYYNSAWGVLSLLMLSGNFLDYTVLP